MKFSKKLGSFFQKKSVDKKTMEEIHEYWKNPSDKGNLPNAYADPSLELSRSAFLLDIIKKHNIQSESKIIEIGCNVGRNLHHLFENGYTNLNGIEISKNAVEKIKEFYPVMSNSIEVFNNPIEEKIKQFKTNEFDLVFSMAVLEHIHPASEWIFQELVRITNQYLITIEDEKYISSRHFPRNYKIIFKKLGMKQIFETIGYDKSKSYKNFMTRVFVKNFEKP